MCVSVGVWMGWNPFVLYLIPSSPAHGYVLVPLYVCVYYSVFMYSKFKKQIFEFILLITY